MDILSRLTEWANQRGEVRAMLLTSTRAQPSADMDALSNYDIVLAVNDIRAFWDNRSWVEDFGEVLVTYWDPVYPDDD